MGFFVFKDEKRGFMMEIMTTLNILDVINIVIIIT